MQGYNASMRLKTTFVAVALFAPLFVFGATAVFTRALFVGVRGEDVRTLQKLLNSDLVTRVADVGPGSKGNETDYFGPATKQALVKFQEKYRNETLAPLGLTYGTGYLGEKTRAKVEKLWSDTGRIPVENPIMPSPAQTVSSTSTSAVENPNLKNIDLYIAAIKSEGLKQGLSPTTLSYIEDKIRREAVTTRDYRQEFFDKQKAAYQKRISINISESPISVFLKKILSNIGGVFFAQKVYAALGIPFGGFITYVNPVICDCPPGIVTQIFVALPNANPAISNLLLNYVNGSEGFNWHNIPEPSIAVLGTYVPAVPSCWTYVGTACVLIPSEGQITPIVGSSLLP
jgi:peptidoglycan hydrolase-like protein with peptidoglycan-binding domain